MKLSLFKTVKSRLLLITIIPLIMMVGLLVNNIYGHYSVSQQMQTLEPTTQLSIQIGKYIHEIQKERGMSAGLLGGATEFRQLLTQQRVLSDKQRTVLNNTVLSLEGDILNSNIKNSLDAAQKQMASIDSIRSQVDNQSVTLGQVMSFYNNHNEVLIQVIKKAAVQVGHDDIRRLRTGYVNFLQLKEKAGQERAILSSVFSLDRFTANTLAFFTALISEQNSFMGSFLAQASKEQSIYFKKQMEDSSITEVRKYRKLALSKLGNQDKSRLLASLYSSIGYGGAIHQFKNYVLRKNAKYKTRFAKRYAEITTIINKLEADPAITSIEKENITIIRNTIEQYNKATETAATMINQGASVTEIDSIIKISDGPAIKALTELSQSASLGNFGVDPKAWFEASTKRINLLKQVEHRLEENLSAQGDELGSSAQNTLLVMLFISIFIVVLVMSASFFVLRSITSPLNKTTEFALQLARGDLTAKIDFTADNEMGELTKALNDMVVSFRDIIEQVIESIQQLTLTADQTSTVTEKTNESMQVQLTETTNMASAIQQMNSMAQSISQNTNDASIAGKEANQEAATGKKSMEATVTQIKQLSTELQSSVTAISELEQNSIEIGTVLDVIKGISEQTNLLALNAAIEAARAGEQGRGFAVVADEVRTLASRTQDSADEISQMINKLQEGAKAAVSAINRGGEQAKKSVDQAVATGENLSTISNVVSQINDMSEQIASSMIEQGNVVDQINLNIGQINEMAQQTAGHTRETENASNELSSITNALKKSAEQFKVS